MKGSVYQRGSKWYYKFRLPQRDTATGKYPWIAKGGFDTEREAWKACREAMRDADQGRVVKPSTRTVAQFLTDWLTAVEPTIDATTWRNWSDYARSYVIPHIGGERLQRSTNRHCSNCTRKLLAEGRIKRGQRLRCTRTGLRAGRTATSRRRVSVAEACETSIHAARAAVRRYRAGIVPKHVSPASRPRPFATSTR